MANLASKFCRCIKKVSKTMKKSTREGISIAICTKSVIQTRGRTLKRFRCRGRPHLETQKKKSKT